MFTNPFYSKLKGKIEPSYSPAILQFWKEHFLLYTEQAETSENPDTHRPFDDRAKQYKSLLAELNSLKLQLSQQSSANNVS
mmetsp:Transcript_36576/g.42102  ORF Transcript_36576/g.42102 Transcript_36576/m.42102 type:complete len:81 (-) Transcript_36576:16-258(-)